MSLNKTLQLLAILAGAVSLSGCIVPAGNNNSYGSSGGGNYHQQQQSGSADYDRGCGDAKAGSYDRSGHASQAYENGWNACKANNTGSQNQNVGRDYDRGCADAKAGSYDRSGNASQAYESGWNACKGNGNQGAYQQGGVEAAKKTCLFQFGSSGYVQTVTALKPGYWEIIVADNSGRKVACTADAQGNVSDWVNM